MILAADVGGTKTLVGLFRKTTGRPAPIQSREFPTEDHSTLADVLGEFLGTVNTAEPIEAACFGVAGPVLGDVAHLTNVPFAIDSKRIGRRFKIPRVALLNDLAAM